MDKLISNASVTEIKTVNKQKITNKVCLPFTPGSLKHYLVQWEQITRNPFVLHSIMGLSFTFIDEILNSNSRLEYKMSKLESDAMTVAILELQKSGIIEVVSPVADQYLSPVFPVPKPDGSVRVILNLKSFNENLEYVYFKMALIRDAISLMKQGQLMFKIDLKTPFI
uniref:Uncharacterized protein n=1 Tax=Strigamia maritima TaxID=126957 RepID=T1IKJ9_STRMM